MKQVVVLADAAEDLEAARNFYDAQEPGVGEYCVDSLFADIVSLGFFSGIHPLHFEFHRMFRANKNWNASSALNSQPSTSSRMISRQIAANNVAEYPHS